MPFIPQLGYLRQLNNKNMVYNELIVDICEDFGSKLTSDIKSKINDDFYFEISPMLRSDLRLELNWQLSVETEKSWRILYV